MRREECVHHVMQPAGHPQAIYFSILEETTYLPLGSLGPSRHTGGGIEQGGFNGSHLELFEGQQRP